VCYLSFTLKLFSIVLQMQQYQYYSVGLLSNYDKFYEHQKMVVGPKKKLSKEQRKLEKKLMKGLSYLVLLFTSYFGYQ